MRLRKLAGATASALVFGTLAGPMLASPAQAATTTATAAVNQDCTSTFGANTLAGSYGPTLAISADGTAVTAPASATSVMYNGANGVTFPTFKMETVTLTVNATVNGEAVLLTGTTTRATGAGVTLDTPLALPALTGTRTGTAAVTAAAVTSVSINGTMRVPYGPPGGTAAAVTFSCSAAQDIEIKQALQCTFGTFSFTYPAVIKARTSSKLARVAPITAFKSGMPAFVPVSNIADNINVKVAGTDLVAKGSVAFDPAMPGNTDFILPAATALRSGVGDVATSDVKVTGATLVMTSGGSDSTVDCVTTAWPTATTLTATSPSPRTVNLAAAVDSTHAAGNVEFKEGATVVATVPVVAGAASKELTGVTAGAHSYTAVYVPTDPAAFATSTSVASSVTVLATQPCIDAEAALTVAQNAVTTATTAANSAKAAVTTANAKVAAATKAVSSTNSAVTKANSSLAKAKKAVTKANKSVSSAKKAVKKAKSKAAKKKANSKLSKAKKALTKAKKAATKANKSVSSAKKASTNAKANLASAKKAQATAAASSVTANSALVAANAARTAAQNTVNDEC